MSSLISYLRNLNLFQPSEGTTGDEHQHRSNIIATRIYLVLLILTLFGLGMGLWLPLQTTKTKLDNPTEDQIKTLPNDAECPCSRLSFSYGTFVTLGANFHQVCSSDFISDRWINAIFSNLPTFNYDQTDFRKTGSAQFQGLAALCRLSMKHVQNGLDSFYNTSFVSSKVLFRELLEFTVQSSISQFQSTMPVTFQSRLELINKMIFGNQLISGLQTSWTLKYDDWLSSVGFVLPNNGDTFSLNVGYGLNNESSGDCLMNYDHRQPSTISNDSWNTFEIPGFFTGCMPINSLLQSTLECFYDQMCVNQILSLLSTNENYTAMSQLEQNFSQPISSIKSIVDRVMIEQWSQNISYEKYFSQCAPVSCTYSIMERHSFIVVLAEIIGLLGGLTLILGLFVPPVVSFIRNRMAKKNKVRSRLSLFVRLKELKSLIKRRLVQMNLFKNQSHDDRHVHYQRIATRLYIVAIIISSIILILYFSLTEEIHRNSVLNPTEYEYNNLYRMYPDSLVCPCTSLSMNYEVFVTVEPIYHQLCLSDFVSPDRINFLLTQLYSHVGLTYTANFLGFQLQLLSSICEYARQTINDSLRVLFQTQLVSSQVTAKQIFDSQISLLIDSWKMNTINGFQQVLQLIRATSEGNKLLSNVFNYYLKINYTLGHVNLKPNRYSNCLCDLSQSCSEPHSVAIITEDDKLGQQLRLIPGFFSGCEVLEATLQSTLECLYDQICVTTIQKLAMNPDDFDFTLSINSTLKITDQGSYEINETVESIVNRLMVNLWLTNISFTSFYNSCTPSSCTYEYTSRHDIYVVFTTAISILGGLSTLFKILTLIVLRFIEKIMEGHSRHNIIQFVRRLFTCRTEQQIANRLNLVLLLIFLFVFYLVSFVPSQTTTVQITKPSLSTYNAALKLFPDSLQCSCSKISFKYGTFLSIEPRFHPICSSDFMSNRWIMYVYNRSRPLGQFNNTDFRATAVGQFQLLISFCELSKKTVNSAILQLNSTDHIDAQTIPEDLLNNQIQTIIDAFQSNTPKAFLGILDLIREITQANQLMSMYSTNWKYMDLDIVENLELLNTISQEYDGCNCGLTSKCTQISGKMRAGCYPLEALLQSTLECFYDQNCIDPNVSFIALNFSSNSTSFNISSNIETILERLMVEEYSINKSYENYFAQCSPSSCSYSYTNHRNTINIITSAIELYGGSVIICKLITVFVMKLYRCRVNRVVPIT